MRTCLPRSAGTAASVRRSPTCIPRWSALTRHAPAPVIKHFMSPEDLVSLNEGAKPLFEKLQPTKPGGDSLKEMVRGTRDQNTWKVLMPEYTHTRGRTSMHRCVVP